LTRGRWIVLAATLLGLAFAVRLSAPPAVAGASLRLIDGRILEGQDVRRDGDVYLLTLEGGAVVPVPADLVAEVGIAAAPEPAPPGLTVAEPQVLAGVAVEPPRTEAQLGALGPPARFQPNVVNSGFQPTYWVPDPANNNFNPSTWAQPPIDPDWAPTSAFDPSEDVLAAGRATWQTAPTDPTWVPQDGFKKTGP
jgi:hypothetical protein